MLWANVNSMKKYDVVLMACEGNDEPVRGAHDGRSTRRCAATPTWAAASSARTTTTTGSARRTASRTPGYPQVVRFASGGHQLPRAAHADDRHVVPEGGGVPRLAGRRRRVDRRPGRSSINDGEHTVDSVIAGRRPAVDLRHRPGAQPGHGRRVLLVHDAGRQRQRLRPHGVQRRPRVAGRRRSGRRSVPRPLRHRRWTCRRRRRRWSS